MIVKHLYKRTITHKGKKVSAWYYWYYDQNHRQIRKSCGQNGKPCLLKRDAEIFIMSLDDSTLLEQTTKKVTFKEFCTGMFDPDSKYLIRCKNRGRIMTESTRKCKQRNLKRMLSKFGNRPVESLYPNEIDNWLLEFNRSNSWRNNVIEMLKDVYKELYAQHQIQQIPRLERFDVPKVSKKGILTPEEIERLFPVSVEEASKIWQGTNKEPAYYSYMFATMFFVILCTGMRAGEARALKDEQFLSEDTILINAMFSDGKRVDHLKKGTELNKKWRVAILPSKAVQMLKTLRTLQPKTTDYTFEYYGRPLSGGYINMRFHRNLLQQGIDSKARKLTIHSLRFTNDTMSINYLPKEDIRLMLGHTNVDMTDYYNRATALDNLPRLMANKDTINNIWN